MKSDIRVVKQIGSISSGEGNWQKELNIVSINNGPLKYDLREWSLDHSTSRNGISLEDEEAKALLAVLKECFKDGEEITIEMFPAAYKADKTGQMVFAEPNIGEEVELSDEELFKLLKEKDIEYIDKRDKGGALWVVGGHELDEVMSACAELGYKFLFSEKGGKVTKHQAGWYLRGNKK